jgi:hypothetical protein
MGDSILGYKVRKGIITESRKSFLDSVMALNNRMVHNVFRTIAYTTRIDNEVIFLTKVF